MKGESNCIFFAVQLYIRRRRKGKFGYIAIRRSRYGLFPHFLYAEKTALGRVRMVSYVARFPRKRLIPPPFFRGKVKWFD